MKQALFFTNFTNAICGQKNNIKIQSTNIISHAPSTQTVTLLAPLLLQTLPAVHLLVVARLNHEGQEAEGQWGGQSAPHPGEGTGSDALDRVCLFFAETGFTVLSKQFVCWPEEDVVGWVITGQSAQAFVDLDLYFGLTQVDALHLLTNYYDHTRNIYHSITHTSLLPSNTLTLIYTCCFMYSPTQLFTTCSLFASLMQIQEILFTSIASLWEFICDNKERKYPLYKSSIIRTGTTQYSPSKCASLRPTGLFMRATSTISESIVSWWGEYLRASSAKDMSEVSRRGWRVLGRGRESMLEMKHFGTLEARAGKRVSRYVRQSIPQQEVGWSKYRGQFWRRRSNMPPSITSFKQILTLYFRLRSKTSMLQKVGSCQMAEKLLSKLLRMSCWMRGVGCWEARCMMISPQNLSILLNLATLSPSSNLTRILSECKGRVGSAGPQSVGFCLQIKMAKMQSTACILECLHLPQALLAPTFLRNLRILLRNSPPREKWGAVSASKLSTLARCMTYLSNCPSPYFF